MPIVGRYMTSAPKKTKKYLIVACYALRTLPRACAGERAQILRGARRILE